MKKAIFCLLAATALFVVVSEETVAAPEGSGFSAVVAEIDIELLEVEVNPNRLTITMLATNNGAGEFDLRLDWRETRIIDAKGNVFTYEDAGSRSVGNLRSNFELPVGIPVRLNVVFTRATTSIETIRLLEMHFPFTDDIIWWESIPVPWGGEEAAEAS